MDKRKNILLVKTVSRYNSLNRYIDEWACSMRKFGCNTCVLDAWSLAQPTLYNHIISTYQFDAVIDVNGILSSWNVTKCLPPETIYVTYLCDPPSAFKTLYAQADERTVIFACDKHFRDYILRYYPSVKHAAFIPLSGSSYPECAPYENRQTDIIFTGTYTSPEVYKNDLLNQFKDNATLTKFAEDLMEDSITNPQYTLPECLARILKKYNVSVSDAEFEELVEDFTKVDFFARFYYREKAIRALLSAGLKIHVFGNGWENFNFDCKQNLIIHKGGSYAACKALANAKLSLNIMPWFKDAFQERIASAMLSKTIAVTDESVYINDKFENGKELIAFSLKDIESLPGRIKYLLSHPKEAAEIAENGYRKAQSHTWSVRVHDMVRKIEKDFNIGLMKGGGDEGKELELEMEFPDKKTAVAEALYQLQKMVDVAENDVAEINSLSATDSDFLMQKFEKFVRQFSGRIDGMDMSDTIRKSISSPDGDISKEWLDLFSMQCKALIGRLLLEEEGLRI